MTKTTWAAAIRHGRILSLGPFLADLRAAGVRAAHFDVFDGRFAAGFGLGTDLVKAAIECDGPGVDLHLQAAEADRLVPQLLGLGCESIALHVETLAHANRAFQTIRDAGTKAVVAISPATPLTALEHLLGAVDRILILAREPGQTTGALAPAVFERIKILKENVDYHSRRIELEVEGATLLRDVAQLIAHGANRIVIENPALLAAGDLGAAMRDFQEQVDAERYVT